jgi:endo-1,4-beta-xylanase
VKQSAAWPIQILFDQPADNKPIGSSFSVLDKTGSALTTVDLTTLQGVSLPNGLFPNGQLYFGTDTMANSSLTVAGLRIESQPTGDWVDQTNMPNYLNGPSLSKAAEGRDVTIGSDFMLDHAIDRRYCQIMAHDFNLAMLSDFSYPGFWPDRAFSTDYDFGPVDRAVDFALQHGWRVRGSHLVWGAPESLPDWLLSSNYTRGQYISILQNHINTVAGHFKGRVQEWSVANEAIERSLCNEDTYYDFWYRKIGPDYIKLAFQTARDADPTAILILNNEYDFSYTYPPPYDCRNPTVKTIEATVKKLNAEGRLVDVVGMQMHLYDDPSTVPPATEVVSQIMQEFAGLGVRVYITEMDVNLAYIRDHFPTPEGPYAFQAGVYKDMLEACLGLRERACGSFTTMGIGDSMSWIVDSCTGCMNEPNAAPLMFDDNFLPKPAYFAVRDALTGTTSAATATP